MTLPASGPISMSMLNTEFGNGSTDQISLNSAFAGAYAQYGDINRNTSAGQNIYYYNTVGANYAISNFYSYNDLANVLWSYNFENVSSVTVDINVDYNSVNLYNQAKFAGIDTNTDVNTSTSSGGSLGNIDLTLDQGGLPNFVDINCYDTDTNATIYQVTGDVPGNYTATTIGSIYGYQRFTLDLYFYD